MTCPPSRFHVPPRTHSAGSFRVQPRGCRVRNPSKTFRQTAFRFFTSRCLLCFINLTASTLTDKGSHSYNSGKGPLCSQLWAASECPPLLFKHSSLLPDCPSLSMQSACSCCLTWIWCLQRCFFFVFFFYNPKHLILNLLAMISVLPLLTQMFEFTTFSFVILCVQCLFSY